MPSWIVIRKKRQKNSRSHKIRKSAKNITEHFLFIFPNKPNPLTSKSKSRTLTVHNLEVIPWMCNLSPNLQVAAVYMRCAQSQRKMAKENVTVCVSSTLTCRIQVVGIGVVSKYWVKVNVKASRIMWLLGCRGGCKSWWGKKKLSTIHILTSQAKQIYL